jgi:transposase
MEQASRRKYSDEFKQEAVGLILVRDYGISEAAHNLGINANMLGRWRREHERHGEHAFPSQGKMTPEQEELHRLRTKNKRLQMERDILKKATAFFDLARHAPLPSGGPEGRPNGSCLLLPGKRSEISLCGTAQEGLARSPAGKILSWQFTQMDLQASSVGHTEALIYSELP